MAVPDTFADVDGDGLDDDTGQPVTDTPDDVPADDTEDAVDPDVEEVVDPSEDFHSVLIVEGVWTGDGRYIEDGALTWRDLPLPLMALDRTTEAHLDARLVGNFTRLERLGREIHGYGTFIQSDDPEVQRLQALVRAGDLRGISADLDAMEYDLIVPASMLGEDTVEEVTTNDDGDGVVRMEDYRMSVTSARIMGATVVPFPAFQEAFIESTPVLVAALAVQTEATGYMQVFATYDDIDFAPPEGAREEAARGLEWRAEYGRGGTEVGVARARDISNGKNLSPDTVNRMLSYFARHEVDQQGEGWSPDEDGFPSAGRIAWALWGGDPGYAWARKIKRQMDSRDASGSILASGHPIEPPVVPPAAWFTDPGLSGPTPLSVSDDGRVFGHLALWDTCHVAYSDRCVRPPRSSAGYAHYRTGEVLCDDGTRVPVGNITMNTGHAPMRANAAQTLAHYDDTGSAVADVVAGEDRFGIWLAGALRPGLSPETVRGLMASDVSGDWRSIGGGLELVAVLAVNVPGFPKLRVHERDGLVASMISQAPIEPLAVERAADRIASTIGRSKRQRAEQVASRIGRDRDTRIAELAARVRSEA